MEWIKVEDRLPEVDVNVIALTSRGKVMVTSMYIPKDCKGKVLGKAEWHGSSTVTKSITYWSYIELPKESTYETPQKIKKNGVERDNA